MLTCDPHLFKFANVQWYFMHLKWKDNFVLGAVIPGMLHFTYCRSKSVSYGMTSMNADSQDIFVERVKDGKYFYENEWHPLQTRTEKFYVRF